MLGTTVVLWALNLTVSRYILTHGFLPLAFSALRYGAATVIFVVLVLVLERTLRIDRSALKRLVTASALLWLNQVAFVYALRDTTASTVGLIFGATPIFAALIALAAGVERATRRFWVAAFVSFAGVALVAIGSGGAISGNAKGLFFAVVTAATWGGYSVFVSSLMSEYSPYRVSALGLAIAWVGIAATGASQVSQQDFDLGADVWLLFAYAVLGPLVITNVLYFRALGRIGVARTSLAVNIQPFVASVFAVVLLSESLAAIQVLGGALIAGGILLARRRRPPADLRPLAD
jgi:drug/metabolite transporter (DMT)-like permease